MIGDTFKVWHRRHPLFMDVPDDPAVDAFPEGFDHVATVTARNADMTHADCFELTNSIDRSWWLNEGVELSDAVRSGARSTSVGDVVECADGRAFLVQGIGWQQIRFSRSAPLPFTRK
jgi:hypothetical protein